MLPTIALVGRPNVGKSTLFNRLTRSRDALVADLPGLTRDRHYGRGRLGGKPHIVVDTGGLEPGARSGIFLEMARQSLQAVDEADVVLFLVDGREGLTPSDEAIARELRKRGRPLVLVVNKSEGRSREAVAGEFHALGLGEPVAISAAHGDGVDALIEAVLQSFPVQEPAPEHDAGRIRVAIVGRPNVGKSTMVNALLGEERVIAFDQPGTTRDSIYIDFERGARRYTLIDTAGVRRRGKVEEPAEKFSVLKALQAIEDANVVILLVDARQDIADQDAHIAGYILDAGRALVVAVNKWDGLDEVQRQQVKRDLERKLGFLSFARLHFVSALTGQGLGGLLPSVDAAYAAAMMKLPTPKLTRALIDATSRQPPPRAGLFRPKLRYAHQGGSNPPIIVIHGNQLNALPDSYRRYLSRCFAETFKLQGTPVRLQFKVTENPYARRK
jgi:GTP-binding protein